MAIALELQSVSKKFGAQCLVSALDFTFLPDNVTWLRGNNAVGKTTLLKMLCGLIRPDAGRVSARRGADRIELKRCVLGAVFSDPMLYGELTVRENLAFFCELSGSALDWCSLCSQLSLDAHLDTKLNFCSQGTKQKAALVRALVANPDFLILDELFTGLDAPSREGVAQIVTSYSASGRGVLVTGHDELLMRELATLELTLRDGKIAEERC